MNSQEFSYFRKRLNKTQREMSQLLGTSIKAIHSYEQGWRTIPTHVERQVLFLVSRINSRTDGHPPCWVTKGCSQESRQRCPAWEFRTGDLCWFINGTICEGFAHKDWKEKMKNCRSCEVFVSQF